MGVVMQEWYQSRALYEAVNKLVSSGDFENAYTMAREISDRSIRAKAFSRIAVEMAKKGMEYKEAINKAIKAAYDINNAEETTKTLMSLAFEFLNLGKIEDALAIARFIKDVSNRSKIEAEVALELARRGRVPEAMKIINGIMDEDVKTWATSRLVNTL